MLSEGPLAEGQDANRHHFLPGSLKAFVETQTANKSYGNVSEYFRRLPQEAQKQEQYARLEALLLEDLASKRIKLDDQFRQNLVAKVDRVLETQAVEEP